MDAQGDAEKTAHESHQLRTCKAVGGHLSLGCFVEHAGYLWL